MPLRVRDDKSLANSKVGVVINRHRRRWQGLARGDYYVD